MYPTATATHMCRLVFLAMAVLASMWLPAFSETMSQPSNAAPPNEVREVLRLMNTPAVKQWLALQPADKPVTNAGGAQDMSLVTSAIDKTRRHIATMATATMTLPKDISNASGILANEFSGGMGWRIAGQLGMVLLAGPVFEAIWSWRRRERDRRRAIHGEGLTDPMHKRLKIAVNALVPAIIFVAACCATLFLFAWPPVSEEIAITIALILCALRGGMALGDFVIRVTQLHAATQADDETPLPPRATMPNAAYWYPRCVLFAAYFAFGWGVIQLMGTLGFDAGSALVVAYLLGIGLLLIAIESIWSRPASNAAPHRRKAMSWFLTGYVVLLWVCWILDFPFLLWVGIYALLLRNVLQIATAVMDATFPIRSQSFVAQRIVVILFERGIRALIIILAFLWLGNVLGMEANMMMMTSAQSPLEKIGRGIIHGFVILLLADLIWNLTRALIEIRLMGRSDTTELSDEGRARQARLDTLLPIFRNVIAGVIGIIAILMVLSGLGVEIAPLIAGAGVVGVAVGFGAQTIVKDVISGLFYLWDDAFRIGEYIETGSHMGTVESFSLRSVKLRHHRGALTTVPFGELGSVKNQSRDWAAEKFVLKVSYDTDLAKLKKVIKQIGVDLLENSEYKSSIIDPLKMKGVSEFGEYAIEVKVGMVTKAGEQFMIRREAMVMIKKAFEENGIVFAFPTVHVQGDDPSANAAAARALRSMQAAEAAEAAANASN